MVRRIVEEDVVTPSSTVVEDDGSWIGRTIVTLVILALVVAGAIWLVRAVSNDDTPGLNDNDGGGINNEQQVDPDNDTVPSPLSS